MASPCVQVHGGHADEAPRTVKLYVNRDVEFDGVEGAVATHTLHMPSTMSDEAEFPLSLAKFNNVSSGTGALPPFGSFFSLTKYERRCTAGMRTRRRAPSSCT